MVGLKEVEATVTAVETGESWVEVAAVVVMMAAAQMERAAGVMEAVVLEAAA